MSLQSNQFEDLLKYLDDETDKTLTIQKDDKQRVEKVKVSTNTKQLIKDSLVGIYSDVGYNNTPVSTSRGFVVKDFESLMRAKLIDEHKRMQSYDRPYISVTELFNCLRKNYYVRKKYKIDISKEYNFSYLYMINKVGNTVHDLIQELYDHTEVEKTLISEKYKVKGRVDGIRSNFLLEYKTIDVDKFTGKYIPNHYHQALIYAYLLNSEYGYKIDTITIVYIIRNLKRIIPFDLPIDDNKAIKFLEVAPILIKCLKNDTVPEPLNSDKEQCHWCQYKSYCKKDSAGSEKTNTNEDVKSVFQM
jgi:CRISPR/Cas system-associated exonuclease Cas4 (RecB family)